MFIHQTPGLIESGEAKEVRQAPIRSFAASAGHRARANPATYTNRAVNVPATFNQIDKISKFRVPNYRTHERKRTRTSRSDKTEALPGPRSLTEQPRVEHETIRECSSTCGVNPIDVLGATFPVEAIQNSLLVAPNQSSPYGMLESRAMHFFITRTAIEWTGWLDEQVWRHFAVQMSVSQPALRHALISLALHHEHLESEGDHRAYLWQRSFAQGRQALDLLVQNYDNMPLSAIIMTYFAITAFTSLLDNQTGYQALQAQYTLLDRDLTRPSSCNVSGATPSQEDLVHYLLFVLRRRRNRHGRVADMIWALAYSPLHNFVVEESFIIPDIFPSLRDARQTLETLLRKTTYQAKIKGQHDPKQFKIAEAQLHSWLEKLQTYICIRARSDDEIQSGAILRICGKIGFMMIEMMYSKDEMAFDKYSKVYEELATAFEQNTIYRRRSNRANRNFVLDSGLLCYVGHTAKRWCRDPEIRQRLIDLLFQSQRQEGIEPARAWAGVCRWIKRIEENGIVPSPLSASDIPVTQRLRVLSSAYFWKSELIHVRYAQPPWQENFVKDLWISYGDHECCISSTLTMGSLPPQFTWDDKPDLCFSRGTVSWKIKDSDQYHTCEALDFHFPLPRT